MGFSSTQLYLLLKSNQALRALLHAVISSTGVYSVCVCVCVRVTGNATARHSATSYMQKAIDLQTC